MNAFWTVKLTPLRILPAAWVRLGPGLAPPELEVLGVERPLPADKAPLRSVLRRPQHLGNASERDLSLGAAPWRTKTVRGQHGVYALVAAGQSKRRGLPFLRAEPHFGAGKQTTMLGK